MSSGTHPHKAVPPRAPISPRFTPPDPPQPSAAFTTKPPFQHSPCACLRSFDPVDVRTVLRKSQPEAPFLQGLTMDLIEEWQVSRCALRPRCQSHAAATPLPPPTHFGLGLESFHRCRVPTPPPPARTGQTALAENGAERRRRTRKGKTGKSHCGC